ncbi:MAG TPA: DUF1540 domain-containing protein [Gammaproteobacteria bacterium]
MKKFSIEMPQVSNCEVTNCVYNVKNACHARAITVGDGVNAMCDTFFKASSHSKGKQLAGVGACKVSACSFNNDYECQADGISIRMKQDNAVCVTFSPA